MIWNTERIKRRSGERRKGGRREKKRKREAARLVFSKVGAYCRLSVLEVSDPRLIRIIQNALLGECSAELRFYEHLSNFSV